MNRRLLLVIGGGLLVVLVLIGAGFLLGRCSRGTSQEEMVPVSETATEGVVRIGPRLCKDLATGQVFSCSPERQSEGERRSLGEILGLGGGTQTPRSFTSKVWDTVGGVLSIILIVVVVVLLGAWALLGKKPWETVQMIIDWRQQRQIDHLRKQQQQKP